MTSCGLLVYFLLNSDKISKHGSNSQNIWQSCVMLLHPITQPLRIACGAESALPCNVLSAENETRETSQV